MIRLSIETSSTITLNTKLVIFLLNRRVDFRKLSSGAFSNVFLFLFQAEAIFQQIGYPEFITNITALEEYFSGVSVENNFISV